MATTSRRPPNRSTKVKPPRRHGPPLEDTWTKLAKAIGEIQNHNASRLSFEEHYRYAYQMVLHKQGTQLFNGVRDIVATHLEKESARKIVPRFPPQSTASLSSGRADPSLAPAALPGSPEGAVDGRVAKGKGRADMAVPLASGPAHGMGSATDRLALVQAGDQFLKAVKEVWDDHVSCMRKLRDVLKYMDKVYTTSPGNGHPSMPTVWDLGLFLFLQRVVRSQAHPIGASLLSTALAQIRLDRDGETVDASVLKSCTDMLGDLTNPPRETFLRVQGEAPPPAGSQQDVNEPIYKSDFEPQFLAETAEYYTVEGARLLASCDAPEYLRRVNKRLADEEVRCARYLHPSTEHPLVGILHDCLLVAHIDGILNHPSSGLEHMVEAERVDDLARLYRLFARISPKGHASVREALKAWIKAKGSSINEGLTTVIGEENGVARGAIEPGGPNAPTSAALQWVQNVLGLRDKTLSLLASAFAGDKAFQTSINEAFTSFVNANRRAPEYISLFLDDNLRKGLKGKTEPEVDETLEKTISLFRYLSDKDVFERYYKSHLAKRLLSGRSLSDDAERHMLGKLKVECGAAFTRDLEGMLKDMKMSAEMAKNFKDSMQRPNQPAHLRPSMDLTVTVGSSSMWPMSQTKPTCTFPPEFQAAMKAYERFYGNRHSGRKLTWRAELGNVDMRVQFQKASHELNVSTLAAVVLLLFRDLDEGERLTLEDIRAATALPDADLRRTLQSLACAKYKVLVKVPKGRDVFDGDCFMFNGGFSSPLARIKILTVTNKVDSGEEARDTQDRVDEDRRLITEACIVRVMKTRQTLGFAELSTEVIAQLSRRFRPNPSVIKTAVEKLIEKEYLMRDPADRKILTYLA